MPVTGTRPLIAHTRRLPHKLVEVARQPAVPPTRYRVLSIYLARAAVTLAVASALSAFPALLLLATILPAGYQVIPLLAVALLIIGPPLYAFLRHRRRIRRLRFAFYVLQRTLWARTFGERDRSVTEPMHTLKRWVDVIDPVTVQNVQDRRALGLSGRREAVSEARAAADDVFMAILFSPVRRENPDMVEMSQAVVSALYDLQRGLASDWARRLRRTILAVPTALTNDTEHKSDA